MEQENQGRRRLASSNSGSPVRLNRHSSGHLPSLAHEHVYREPIVIISNPWKTWVAWLSISLLCVSLSIVLIILVFRLWYLALVLAGFSITLALHAKREKYTFDMNSGRCTLSTLSVLGRDVQEYWFHEIKEVRLEESTDTQGGTEVDLYLVLRSGKKINMLASHLCGLEAQVKRQVWSEISEYLHGSKSQNNLEFLEEIKTVTHELPNAVEMSRL